MAGTDHQNWIVACLKDGSCIYLWPDGHWRMQPTTEAPPNPITADALALINAGVLRVEEGKRGKVARIADRSKAAPYITAYRARFRPTAVRR